MLAVGSTDTPVAGGGDRPDADLGRPPAGGLAVGAPLAWAPGVGNLHAIRAASAGPAPAGIGRPRPVSRPGAGLRMGRCRSPRPRKGRSALPDRVYLGLADRHACASTGGAGGHRIDVVMAAGRAS